MNGKKLAIKTRDGVADSHIFYPKTTGQFPAVLFYMDGLGIRPNLLGMAERLADNGYVVLLPNMFYRAGPAIPVPMEELAKDGPARTRMITLVQSLTGETVISDTQAFLDYLDGYPRVKGPKLGCLGYCMGGSMALRAAGTFPERVAAAVSIHGARLATDQPDSPHLLASRMQANIYVGVAGIDPWLFPGETQVLKDTFDANGVRYRMEEYVGATHGFAPPGNAAYDRTASEKHWDRLISLFEESLR